MLYFTFFLFRCFFIFFTDISTLFCPIVFISSNEVCIVCILDCGNELSWEVNLLADDEDNAVVKKVLTRLILLL